MRSFLWRQSRRAARGSYDDSDETKIRGTWQLVSKTHKGVETKIDAKGDDTSDDQQMIFTFEEQSWKVKVGRKGVLVEKTGTYSLDPKQTPKLLDLTIQGDTAVTDVHAVYETEQGSAVLSCPRGRPASARL